MSLSAGWIGVVVVVVVSSIVICWVKYIMGSIPMTIHNNKVTVVPHGSIVWV
jgi:hypothetical protein